MDLLHEQIAILNAKIDALHKAFEQFSSQTSAAITDIKFNSNGRSTSYSQASSSLRRSMTYSSMGMDGSMDHKDILADTDYVDSEGQTGEQTLSSEIQIQRLTAQLTAAYNRIAALEEQLLARRVQ